MRLFISLLVTTTLVTAFPQRDQRAIALFNVVTFPNIECQSTENEDNKGTCFSSTECSDKGGTAEGNCASGFGVCCIITVDDEDGGDVSHNNTIVENKDFPSVYDEKSKKATYKIKPLDDICFFRFDFIKMDLAITANTGKCDDTLTVTVPTEAGSSPPVLCGLNDGQHMYADNLRQTGDTTLEIATSANAYDRKWKIKIAQINCDCPVKPQPGCTQFFTASCGEVQSMNYGATTPLMVANFGDTICFRENSGKCSVTVAQSTDESSKDTFSLLDAIANNIAVDDSTNANSAVQSNVDANPSAIDLCSDVRLQIGSAAYCGEVLSSKRLSKAAGPIDTEGNFFIKSVQVTADDVKKSKGFKLSYTQTGCV